MSTALHSFTFEPIARLQEKRPQPADPKFVARRGEAMRAFFPKLAAWFARKSYESEMRAVDRYLSQSKDIFELERRIRQIERNGFYPHFN